MRVNAPTISEHRLQRFERWMLLWLKWFAAFLREARAFAPFSNQAAAIAHQWLDRIEAIVINIILIRAAPHVRTIAPPKHAPCRYRATHRRRAIIGVAMRRALRAKGLHQRIAALSTPLDILVARLLKRIPRGLTRRRPIHTRPEARPITCAIAYAEPRLRADTS